MAPSLLGFVILILLTSPSLARSPPPPPPWPLAIDSKLCGSDRVVYEESAAGYRLIINERIVDDPLLICTALEAYSVIGCFAAIRRECCDRDTYGRRGLLEVAAAPDQGNWTPEERRRHRGIEKKDFAVPGMLLLCCVVICPCFRSRRRSVGEHQALSKELSSMESVSSLDINSASEKAPGTPLRIPPSPARVPPSPSRFSISPQLSRVGSIHLSVSQIYKATQNFSPSLRLGEGGFGTVYKAVLPDGQVVAVKRAKKEHLSTLRDEFSNEVELLSKIEHRSLVKLLGYTEKGNERIIITEHVPNGTLREHLDGQHGKILDFNQRLEIAIDVAHALTYLHLYAEKTIIHRDVKSSNILLTENYRAKVSDFGFAKGTSEADQTHIMTKVKGTAGYLDPEYLQTYQLTPKSDVFSFGILLIEILSGRRPVELKRAMEERITVRWAFKLYNDGNLRGILDPLLKEAVDKEVLARMIGLAFQCAAPTRADRPVMKEVAEQLWEIRKDYGRSRGG